MSYLREFFTYTFSWKNRTFSNLYITYTTF